MIIIIKKIIVFTKPVSIKPITVGQSKRVCMLKIYMIFSLFHVLVNYILIPIVFILRYSLRIVIVFMAKFAA